MDNEITKISNLYYLRQIQRTLKILQQPGLDNELMEKLHLIDYIFTSECSEKQEKILGRLQKITRILFVRRFMNLLRYDELVKKRFIAYNSQLYDKTMYYYEGTKFHCPHETDYWMREVMMTIGRIVTDCPLLRSRTFPFSQL